MREEREENVTRIIFILHSYFVILYIYNVQ